MVDATPDPASDEPVRLTDPAFVLANGIVAELNRRILHPLGLALEAGEVDDDGVAIFRLWDYRDDPEGIYFVGESSVGLLPVRQAAFAQLWNERAAARIEALGYVIQPTGAPEVPRVLGP